MRIARIALCLGVSAVTWVAAAADPRVRTATAPALQAQLQPRLPAPVEFAYGPHPLQRLDVYPPALAPATGCVLLVHGGGWAHGDKRQMTAPMAHFAALFHAAGWAVASANYRLAPDTSYPGPVHDVVAAAAWLHDRCPAKPIVLLSESAGSNLGGMAAALAPRLFRSHIALGGVYSLPSLPAGWVYDLAAQYVGCDPATCTAGSEASPASAWPDAVPTLLVHGALDDAVPWTQSAAVADAHKSAELWLVPQGLHTGPTLMSPDLDVAVLAMATMPSGRLGVHRGARWR